MRASRRRGEDARPLFWKRCGILVARRQSIQSFWTHGPMGALCLGWLSACCATASRRALSIDAVHSHARGTCQVSIACRDIVITTKRLIPLINDACVVDIQCNVLKLTHGYRPRTNHLLRLFIVAVIGGRSTMRCTCGNFSGVARNLSYPFQFVVFTEADVELSIGDEKYARYLWAYHHGESRLPCLTRGASFTLGQPGTKCWPRPRYRHLRLDELASYHGTFAIAGTRDFVSEGAAGSYNSSVLALNRDLELISISSERPRRVRNYVKRLDHWLEMTIGGADTFQDLFLAISLSITMPRKANAAKALDDNAESHQQCLLLLLAPVS